MAAKDSLSHVFELYILEDKLTAEQWTAFNRAIVSHMGVFGGKYELVMSIKDNVVRFFVRSDQDLSGLSNSISGLLIRIVPESEITLPTAVQKERFLQFVTGGNLLDLKERQQVQKTKSLEYATFKVRALAHDKMIIQSDIYFELPGKTWSIAHKTLTSFPFQLLSIDFTSNTHYLKKTVPKYLNIEKATHMLVSENLGALVEVDTFPYFTKNYYLGLTNYEFDKHSFIIGASGSGKSKFISLFVDRLAATQLATNYRVIVIDPHASLAADFEHIQNKQIVNFSGESTQLFGGSASDISAATELTATLFKSLMSETASPKTDRVLRFSLYVLLTAQTMSLHSLKRYLTEVDFRNQVLDHVKEYVPANITHFFGADFNEMRTKYYDEALSPIISLVDEMQMQPALVGEGELSLERLVQDNFLTVFSLNKVSMGDRVVKTVAGLLIQQIFLLAQARAFSQRVLLIIDEVSVVQNPALAAILSEARKFNLTVMLTQQYFGQIEEDLRAAIFANVYNYYTFKVSEEDARALEGNMNIEIPAEIVEAEHAKGIKEKDLRIKIMTELHPRECLIRVISRGQVVPAIKARTLDAPKGSGLPTHETKLKSYTQKPVALPQKFEERAIGEFEKTLKTPIATTPYQTEANPDGNPPYTPEAQPISQPVTTGTPTQDPLAALDDFMANMEATVTGPKSPESAPSFSPERSAETLATPAEAPKTAEEEPRVSPYEIDPAERGDGTVPKLGNAAVAPISQSLPAQTFNLGELLASHSSSRIKLNRKDQTKDE
jgi:hypothetical protein